MYGRFLGIWAQAHIEAEYRNELDDFDHSYYITVGAIILAFIFIISLIRRLITIQLLLLANNELHNRMLKGVSRSKIAFFDNNPIGIIINRFSNDLGILDKPNLITFFDSIDGTLQNIGMLIVICSFNPWLFIPFTILVYYLIQIKNFFKKSSVVCKKN